MLKNLKIENVALIDKLEVEFSPKLNVLTGETGAGKSIIIDSINFVVGGRVLKSLIRQGQNKMKVEALFYSPFPVEIFEILKKFDIDFDEEELLITRSMTLEGKSDIKVNGTTITNSMLKMITGVLIDIHGQHEHQQLLKDKFHLQIIDNFIKENNSQKKLDVLYKTLLELNTQIQKLNGSTQNQERMLDLLSYQINEIEDAKIKENEDDQLFQKKIVMQNYEKIFSNLVDALGEFDSLPNNLKKALLNLNNILKFDETFIDLVKRTESCKFEIADILETLKQKQENFDFDQREFEEIDERLDKIKMIKKKYGPTLEEVKVFLNKSKIEYDDILNSKNKLKEFLTKKEDLLKAIYFECCELSKTRRKIANQFENNVKIQLNDLGMKNSKFLVLFNNMPELEMLEENLTQKGFDKVSFMFSANVGQDLKPLSEIISGGEAGRFMLALKNIIADSDNIPSMIFDEIDTGISGEMGYKVACKLANISRRHQVMAVSHLPQICAIADKNIKVYKTSENNQTKVFAESLAENQILKEISRLSGGLWDSAVSIEHAKELKKRCNVYKNQIKE